MDSGLVLSRSSIARHSRLHLDCCLEEQLGDCLDFKDAPEHIPPKHTVGSLPETHPREGKLLVFVFVNIGYGVWEWLGR